MKKVIIQSCLFFLFTSLLTGQEFISEITFDYFFGNIDTVHIGYDENASYGLDANFGESDISNDAEFRNKVQLAQIDILKFKCGDQNVKLTNISNHQSQIDIIPKECIAHIPHPILGDFTPFTAVLIPNNRIPVLMKWDKSEFESVCLLNSLVTDWKPDYWWDVYCPNVLLENISMKDLTAILIDRPVGDQIINQFDDTLSLVYVALIGDIELSTSNISRNPDYTISPNPTNGNITILAEEPIERVEVYDLSGKLLISENKTNKIQLIHKGIHIIKTTFSNGDTTMDKIVNLAR